MGPAPGRCPTSRCSVAMLPAAARARELAPWGGSMTARPRRTRTRASRPDRLNQKKADRDAPARALSAVRRVLCALGLLFFPSTFAGSLWLVPAFAAVGSAAWLFMEGRRACPRELALLIVLLLAYFAPSVMPCWTGAGFCSRWLIDQEAYLLTVGLLLYVCGYVAVPRTGRPDAYTYGAALGAYIAIAVVILVTRDNLTQDIEPPFFPLFVERNDLAPLVAWMFFVCALFRTRAANASVRLLALLIVVAVASVLSLATQSRLVAMVSILGVLFFARVERRMTVPWWIALGVAVACFLAIEYPSVERLVRRAVLAEGGTSLFSRMYLWRNGWDMFLTAPSFGHGLGGFAELFDAYRQDGAADPGLDARFTPWPHNVFIEILVEKGIAGLAAFLGLLAVVVANLTGKPRQDLRGARRAAAFLLVTLIIIGVLDSTTKRLWYLPSLLYVMGLSAGISQRRDSPIAPAPVRMRLD
jgi:O-antigen ligase